MTEILNLRATACSAVEASSPTAFNDKDFNSQVAEALHADLDGVHPHMQGATTKEIKTGTSVYPAGVPAAVIEHARFNSHDQLVQRFITFRCPTENISMGFDPQDNRVLFQEHPKK